MRGSYSVVHPDTSELPRPAWLELRRTGIGSSDAAPALTMSPWRSQYALWADKRGLLPDEDDEGNERFLWGRLVEPLILSEARRRRWTGGGGQRHLMLRSDDHPWMLANPDELTIDQVVEAKTADGWDESRWDAGVPDHYTIQAHHLMVVTGRRECVFPVLFGGNVLRCFIVEWDEVLAQRVIEGTCALWERVLDNDPPDVDGSEATMLALRVQYTEVAEGKTVELPESIIPDLRARVAQEEIKAKASAGIDLLKARLMALMEDAEVGTVGGEAVCTWKRSRSGQRRFLFKKEIPWENE